MPFTIVRNDITKMNVDAVVNAANPALCMGGGVCGAIFRAAGEEELSRACAALGGCETGQAVITSGFGLSVQYIVHAVGPVYRDGRHGEAALLRACYLNALTLATERGCQSIAFPLISSGSYGYPKSEAFGVAAAAIASFLQEHEMTVYLAVFDRAALAVSQALLGAVQQYIDQNYVDEQTERFARLRSAETVSAPLLQPYASAPEQAGKKRKPARAPKPQTEEAQGLDALVGRLDESFSETLLRLIDAKGKTDAEVYKRANIDRRHFSKIRSNPNYMPGKRTALAFAVALELTEAETRDLLSRAGYALSGSQKLDVIVQYFISNQTYDIFKINEVLFHYDQPLLGS